MGDDIRSDSKYDGSFNPSMDFCDVRVGGEKLQNKNKCCGKYSIFLHGGGLSYLLFLLVVAGEGEYVDSREGEDGGVSQEIEGEKEYDASEQEM